jgi:hypothetical protein
MTYLQQNRCRSRLIAVQHERSVMRREGEEEENEVSRDNWLLPNRELRSFGFPCSKTAVFERTVWKSCPDTIRTHIDSRTLTREEYRVD